MMDKIIQQYQDDEHIMIQLFAAWCANHQLDAFALYAQAYPLQQKNIPLINAVKEIERDTLEIDTETVVNVLQLFGNEDLAFVVLQEAKKIK
ncbi:hypothetical protein [Bacillus sp. FJAT-22090]|uniref:hypothetical protein n=1 Tax=Bacillus sp. FJAT-22090 TaxID=1581038 RepID=UPI0011A2F2B5|nr:hypothetical protein [Bacillus sp. FJAT-22090]